MPRLPLLATIALVLAPAVSILGAEGPPPSTNPVPQSLKSRLFGMRGFPPIPAGMDPQRLFPMIDMFGQYRHKDWPGKTHTLADLARRKDEEAAELAKHPGPADWDQYGGWKAGPQLAATGRFRTEKRDQRWWLVDPEGRLFWSHGIDCVGTSQGMTPITDRRQWFECLPDRTSLLGQFYGEGTWAPHNYYENKPYQTYNFAAADLLRKYGPGWEAQFAELAHRRLRSWGMNTVGNWSDPAIAALRKTPYVATIHSGGRPLGGSQGYWGKFPDAFDPSFAATVRAAVARQQAGSAADPWCLGYFVDNELSWGDELSLAVAALVSPPDQPAKRVLLEDLKAKYPSIERLNQGWGTAHASWDALLESRTAGDAKKAHDDLAAFATKFAEQYFRVCREAVKQAAPEGLYLGCRFAWGNDRAVRAAAKYCDVLSFNRYQRDLKGFRLPAGVDRPVLIGEFHFGALDRGMFHTGLVPVADQQARAAAYENYVRSGLAHPEIVGTHWFQFGDQATTGRGDGENYQIGFLDVCDTPYAETVAASRAVGEAMYRERAGQK
ncbi:MAG: beta-agarase [Thermoguttaceae bacterium]